MTIQKSIHYFKVSLEGMQLSPHTLKAYMQDLNQWQECIEAVNLEEINFEMIQDYLIELQSQDLKPASLKRKRVVLHRFLKFCYEKRLCDERLYEYIDPIKMRKTKAPKEILTTEEIEELIDYIDGQIGENEVLLGSSNHFDYLYYCWIRNRLLIGILLYTGCRATEAVSIKKQDINIQTNSILLLAKGFKYNNIPIHPQLLEFLGVYQMQLKKLENKEILSNLEASPYMFPSRQDSNKHLASRSLHDLMLKLSTVLGRHIHAHIFRHTFASYCIAAKMDITTLSSLISHSNPSITLSIYTHEIEASQKQNEIKKLNFDRR
ncbi:tyrosine-type recombinase/integrase [Niameybacter massiliensis]|uniref:Tyrosine-type recombinase/integrase n=1 Tax=Holtiella tumoricola TaxID=3018743 RepID=A0AA42DK92_9FIRM|nr:tyrosine-type recombinase/integrase [Holtiella tumoricola]MDA3730406.1 tyrosine-type recombinase/integrase [Holtiella tumoricola]